MAEGLLIAPYTAIDPAQAKTPFVIPALNHFVPKSKNTTSVIDLERRDQASDHMIFVIADDFMLNVVASEKESQGAFEGIDVEANVYKFF